MLRKRSLGITNMDFDVFQRILDRKEGEVMDLFGQSHTALDS